MRHLAILGRGSARRQSSPRGSPPVFDNGIVSLAAGILLACYAILLARGWLAGYTLLGHRDLAKYDFSFFWTAGRLALAGKAAAAYDWKTLDEAMAAALGNSPWYSGPFFYPPVYLLLMAPFGLLPYAIAAALWLALTLAAYLAAIRRILKGGTAILAALAAPSVVFTLWIGQNGLLTAGLVGGALAILDERPLAAGVLIGCLAYKPQFGLLFPVFLAVTGRWRTFAAAAGTVAVLAAAALLAFGWDAFAAFARSMPIASDALLRHGQRVLIKWQDLESVYGTMRAIGASAAAAWSVHIAVAAAAVAVASWMAVRPVSDSMSKATVATAAVIITPYTELNDLTILTVPMAFLVEDGLRRGFSRFDVLGLIVAFLAPVLIRDAFGSIVAIGPIMCGALAAVIGARLFEPSRAAET